MQNDTTPHIVRTTLELGSLIRDKRKQAGYTSQESAARACLVGKRFFSECERGKASSEIGKILDVLHGLGLEMAVVHRAPEGMQPARQSARPLSRELGLDFPYDWSNPGMSEDVFIHHVLEKGRFMDVLRLVRRYGADRIESVAQAFVEAPNWPRLRQILERIHIGKARATV